MKKQDVLDLLEQLPEEFPAAQLIHELHLLAEGEWPNTDAQPNSFADEELVELSEDWYE